jgi:hypothetical protein
MLKTIANSSIKTGLVVFALACAYYHLSTTNPTTTMANVPLVKLNNGVEIPAIGLGESDVIILELIDTRC